MSHRSFASRWAIVHRAVPEGAPRTTLGHLPATQRGVRPRTAIVACCVSAVLILGAAGQVVAQTGGGAEIVRAEVVQPVRRNVTRTLNLPATLAADEQVDLFAKASGFVGMIEHDIGDTVSKGDVLVTLDIPEMADQAAQQDALVHSRKAAVEAARARGAQTERDVESARAEVLRAEAQTELDRLNLTRREDLREGNAIPQQDLDEARSAAAISQAQVLIAKAGVMGAEAALRSARADMAVAQADVVVAEAEARRLTTLMGYARIVAPFDGVITMRNVDHGAFVRSAEEGESGPVLRVAKVDRIRVVLDVPEADAAYVRRGTKVILRVRAVGTAAIEATVSRIAHSLDHSTRTMRAEIDVPNPDGRLFPGMIAHVAVELEVRSQALMIPSKAIRTVDGKTVVYVVRSGIAQSIVVSIGYDDGIQAEVLSGLQGDEQVIVAANSTVVAGTPVSVTTSGT